MSSPRPFAAAPGWSRPGIPGVGDGGPVVPEAASSEAILRALLDVANQQTLLLEGILHELREQVAQGYILSVTRFLNTLVPVDVPFSPGLFTLSITNDGPGIIQYRLPNRGSAGWVNLNPTEVIQVNFIKPVISSVGLSLTAAGTATVRLVGTY